MIKIPKNFRYMRIGEKMNQEFWYISRRILYGEQTNLLSVYTYIFSPERNDRYDVECKNNYIIIVKK